jgi:ubiquinone/menaquinone biosynthesis C-methylase UbiE
MAADSTRVRHEYDELSAVYDRRWRRYVDRTIAGTLRRVAIQAGESILDVGCGTGALLDRVAAAKRTGVDLSLAMLARARVRDCGCLVAGDAQRLPFCDSTFDVAVSTSSFHFWPAPSLALAEIHRVLRPRGRLVVTDWCDDFLACRLYERLRRRNVYSTAECARLLADAGFAIDEVDRYKVSWLWGMMTVSASRA